MTDLPFGKRLGSRADNRTLYPQAIEQMRRALRPSTAPAAAPAAAAQPPQQARRAPADNPAAPSTEDLTREKPPPASPGRTERGGASGPEAQTDGGDGSAQGVAGPVDASSDAPLELVLLSADRHGLTTAVITLTLTLTLTRTRTRTLTRTLTLSIILTRALTQVHPAHRRALPREHRTAHGVVRPNPSPNTLALAQALALTPWP